MDRGLRVVFVDRPAEGIEADTVLVDNRGLGRRMAELAVERGHRRIGILLGNESVYTHRERFAGIREALRAAGVGLDPDLVVSDITEPHGAEGVHAASCRCGNHRPRCCAPTTG
ncbi:LacI family transcriptional regulator [Tessaracoccus sp. HDW20]|uniref:substrate-binding domain-containing protein n=1 Tax=Tessaracoccus coleopterorum TaxID=2714950 RepID=UPI0018D46AC2|nr:substrate-binding domain-containing protein [Tessaracoccus coleopterorum]NHB84547.1 LacI family transcriptional regulator [Tessaracoccus coleopterorum]